jgi:hypothetical protein
MCGVNGAASAHQSDRRDGSVTDEEHITQLRDYVDGLLANCDPAELRWRRWAADRLEDWARKVHRSSKSAAKKRIVTHVSQRLSGAGGAAVGAASGGALVSQLTGTGAVVFGWFVLALSVVAAALAAALPEAEYVRNRDKRRAYDRLFRDIWTYATLGLPTDDRETVKARLEEFSEDIEAAGPRTAATSPLRPPQT